MMAMTTSNSISVKAGRGEADPRLPRGGASGMDEITGCSPFCAGSAVSSPLAPPPLLEIV